MELRFAKVVYFGEDSLASPYALASLSEASLVTPDSTLVLQKTCEVTSPNAWDALASPEEAILALAVSALALKKACEVASSDTQAR